MHRSRPSPGLPVVLEDRGTPGLLEAEVVDPLPVSRHDARRGVVVRQHAAVHATGKEPPLWLQSGQAGDVPQALGGKRLLVGGISRGTSPGSASGHDAVVSPAGPGATTARACRRSQGPQAEGSRAWAGFRISRQRSHLRDLLTGVRAQIQRVVLARQDLSCERPPRHIKTEHHAGLDHLIERHVLVPLVGAVDAYRLRLGERLDVLDEFLEPEPAPRRAGPPALHALESGGPLEPGIGIQVVD